EIGMEFLRMAKSVRLKSQHNKYLKADSDQETVAQDRCGTSKSVKWTVESVDGVQNVVVRFVSCYGRYLKASDEEFLLGVTGRKVIQTAARKLDSSLEWEPMREGADKFRLKTRYGNYLRANGGLPPWRNSITHDIPHRHRDWILWEIDVVEYRLDYSTDSPSSSSFHLRTPPSSSSSHHCGDGFERKSEGRLIYYSVIDDDDPTEEAAPPSFQFNGNGLEELTQKLEEKCGLEDIIVCSRNVVNGKLYPLRLALPPNNATMHVVVVPPSSNAANEFLPP
ncbi:hypothetical protein M569_09759, partial [Genlisea aurea]